MLEEKLRPEKGKQRNIVYSCVYMGLLVHVGWEFAKNCQEGTGNILPA